MLTQTFYVGMSGDNSVIVMLRCYFVGWILSDIGVVMFGGISVALFGGFGCGDVCLALVWS